MGRLRAIIPILLALLVAVGGSLLLYSWVKRQTAPKEVVKVVESDAVPVAVATVDLAWGTQLKPEMVKTVPFLKESLPPDYFSDPAALGGRVLVTSLKQNEPVTEARLAPESVTTGGVSAVLSPGKRALAVKGDKVIGISGFIHPGDRVDVLVSMTDPESKKDVTKLVLQNIPVLATGTEIQKDGKETSPIDVYTLEMTPEEGEKLALAATLGKLQFALRNITDSETVLTRGATIPETLASFRSRVPTKSEKTKGAQTVHRSKFTMEIIKGDKVSKKTF
jgi:pilus assembly protein CpaB